MKNLNKETADHSRRNFLKTTAVAAAAF
ncbi:MAG: twin-arginine translocation signal domain-containing protein, partial [Flavobacterium sp.]